MAFYHRLWAANTVKQHWAWHDITAFRQHTRSINVRCNMPSPPLDNTLSKTTLGVACHHRRWAARTVERHRAWHVITSLGLHTWSEDVGRGMTSPPLDSTHVRQRRARHDITALGQHNGRQRRARHAITALGQHTRSDDVGHDMTSPPLDCTHGRMMSGVS